MNWLLRLYPRGWQERYGEEFAALLADASTRTPGALLVWDVMRGAFDAHRQEGLE